MQEDQRNINNLQKRLCLMLAYQAAITHDKEVGNEIASRIIAQAQRMSEFCNKHFLQTFPEQILTFVDDKRSAKLNNDLIMYGEELQKYGSTTLPDDRDTLLELYDRIAHRKAQYSQLKFYAYASKEELSASVLRLLKEVNDLRMPDRQTPKT